MTILQRITNPLHFDKIKLFYNDNFPFEVRFICANWIECQIQNTVDFNHPQYAQNFILNLIQQLEMEKQKLLNPEDLQLKHRIDGAISRFSQNIYNAHQLYEQVREAIFYEEYFMENCHADPQMIRMDAEAIQICANLYQLYQMLYNLENAYQQSTVQYGNVREFVQRLVRVRDIVVHKRLIQWQREQTLAGIGGPWPANSLDEIQSWFIKLADLIYRSRGLVDAIKGSSIPTQDPPNPNDPYECAHRELTMLIQSLIVSAFIVEHQPPQVLKKDTSFKATVRLLLPNIGINVNNSRVSVSILSETQAQAQQKNYSRISTAQCGEIINNVGPFEFSENGANLKCHFNNLQLKKIKRTEKKGAESVKDEKSALLFQSTFQIGDMHLNCWVMSLPIVAIVHGNQEPQSWATITWDNAFCEINRVAFAVVNRVPWSRLANVLSMKFAYETGRNLSDKNLNYLYKKMFPANYDYDAEELVSWSLFCKEPLPGRCFTFWDWFYGAMSLIRRHLFDIWNEDLVIGFINKYEAEEMLLQCEKGTFLLRFADSEPGGITVGWVDQSPNGEKYILNLEPFFYKDLNNTSLSNRIKDLTQCEKLYPNIPKDDAFGKHYAPMGKKSRDGYVPFTHQTVVATTSGNVATSPRSCCSPNEQKYNVSQNYDMQGGIEECMADIAALDDLPVEDLLRTIPTLFEMTNEIEVKNELFPNGVNP